MVAGFSIHRDAEEARRRGIDGFQFFRYAVNALVANETRPGRSRLWEEYEELRGPDLPTVIAPGIGTPENYRELVGQFQDAGVDQILSSARMQRDVDRQLIRNAVQRAHQ